MATTNDRSGEETHAIRQRLSEMGVTVEDPVTSKEESLTHALEAFAYFVLYEQPKKTLAILEHHCENGSMSVGELSGGNSAHSIYRISIQQSPTLHSQEGAAEILLASFAQQYPQFSLTSDKLQQYMLNMCNKRQIRRQEYRDNTIEDRTYDRLGNFMFILSLGPVHGQVRHIDHMDPNLQICLYMSPRCPSTIVYDMEGPVITNCLDLKDHWGSTSLQFSHESSIPELLSVILTTMGDVRLATKDYAKYFGWVSLNNQLNNFGRLFQPVDKALQISACDPGTTLIAGGSNHVHAGPPANEPRMFAFAIGIPEEQSGKDVATGDSEGALLESDADQEENDGEVQYSPTLLHIDLCCILFGTLDFDIELQESMGYNIDQGPVFDSKHYLLEQLLPLLREYPNETYSQHFGENRALVREWLEKLVAAQTERNVPRIKALLKDAVASDVLMYSPDVISKSFHKNQQRRQRRNERRERKQRMKSSLI